MATVSRPAVTLSGTTFFLGKIRVSGPGQNLLLRRLDTHAGDLMYAIGRRPTAVEHEESLALHVDHRGEPLIKKSTAAVPALGLFRRAVMQRPDTALN